MTFQEVENGSCVCALAEEGLPLGQHLLVAPLSCPLGTGVEDAVDLSHQAVHLWMGRSVVPSMGLSSILPHLLQAVLWQ